MLSPEGVEKSIRGFRAKITRHIVDAAAELNRAELIDLAAEGALDALADRLEEVEACLQVVTMSLGAIATLETVRDAR